MTEQGPERKAGDETLTLVPSRWENIWPFLGCVAVTAAGIWLIALEEIVGWFALVFFGAGSAILGLQVVQPERWRLEIGPERFRMVSPFADVAVAWADVGEFGIWVLHGRARVAWRQRGAEGSLGRRASRVMSGWDGAMPSSYGRPAKQLKALLEERWRRAIDSPET